MGQELEIPARLEIQGINVSILDKLILENLTFSVPHGERVAVVGPNGAGKSTLFKALVGLLPIKNGQILIHGLPWGHHQDCVAYVPQREEVDWRFPVSVEDVVMMGRFDKTGWFAKFSKKDHEVAMRCMDQLGILPLAKKTIGDLSGGQQQRVFLARALAQEPHILLMDEPFTGVDASTQEVMFALLDELKKEKVTVMVSTHDLNMAGQRFDKVLLLHRKLIAYGKPEEVFTRDHVTEGFGGQVLYLHDAVVIDQCCPGDEHNRSGDE